MPARDQVDPAAVKKKPETQTHEWPTLSHDALYGLAGDVVRTLDPYTEADQSGVLFAFLASAGCYFDTKPHLYGGNTEHPGRVWPLLTGATSEGAKGTAMSVVQNLIRAIDYGFSVESRASGLSTAEGLIRRVRDGNGLDPDDKNFDEGVHDKRLIVWEPEFVNVLSRARREGNSLSGTMRDAYDGIPLQTLTSLNPLIATGHMITIIGAITPTELIEKLTATDITNGFANRFIIVCTRRSKLLPDGGIVPQDILDSLTSRFRDAATAVSNVKRMGRTEGAADLWASEYHDRFGRKLEDGPVATMFARWHAHSARLSVIYALLDGSAAVEEKHVRAALAAWDYIEGSVRYVFGAPDADPTLGRLMEFVNNAEGDQGRTRNEISVDLFRNNLTAKQLDVVCGKLLQQPDYETVKRTVDKGRPPNVYRRRRAA